MSTHLKEKEEKILTIFERLCQRSATGVPVIVEGKKDAESLRALSVGGKIIEAKTGGKSILEVISVVKEHGAREAILLLDFDRRGIEWTKRLRLQLEKMSVKPNMVFWERLRNIVGHDVKDIEGLVSYMETLKRKIGDST